MWKIEGDTVKYTIKFPQNSINIHLPYKCILTLTLDSVYNLYIFPKLKHVKIKTNTRRRIIFDLISIRKEYAMLMGMPYKDLFPHDSHDFQAC